MADIKKHDLLELEIESIAFGGKGVAKIDNFVIFVRDTLPGQRVRALVIKKKAAFAEALVREMLRPAPGQIQAPCPYFADCGGCKFQNLLYEKQLEMKKRQVREVYAHLAGMPDIPVSEVLPAPAIYAYRNKMDFSTGVSRWLLRENDPGTDLRFAIGLHAPGRFDRILDIDRCLLQDEERNAIFRTVREWVRQNGITLNDQRTHRGFLRNVIIRKGEHSGEIMINLVTRFRKPEQFAPLVKLLKEKYPVVTSVVNNITASKGDHSIGEHELLLYGDPVIHDRLGKYDYQISANAFFQTNTRGAEQLYDTLVDMAAFKESDVVWDLYCGTGTISLYAADHVRKVVGFELVRDAVNNARENARRNKVKNCAFHQADLDHFWRDHNDLLTSLEKPDIAVVDPPRAGLSPKFIRQLTALGPSRIVYVSCNPSTQARDILLLTEENYQTREIRPVDMFPHTAHIETIALLIRKRHADV